ncbi:MAG TPA: response regulator [Opitutaceae bacterium]|nr:response regulator [Opitutaceae bacterium]
MCARTRILLVNDDDDALFLLGRSVRRALPEADVALLRDAPTALAYCQQHHIDALVTDNTMPHMDGLTLVRAVRQRDRTLPIVMVTNSTHLSQQATEAGVTAYLPSARWSDVGTTLAALLQA